MLRSLVIIAVACSGVATATAQPTVPRARNNHVVVSHQPATPKPIIGPARAPVTIEFFCRVADRYTSKRIYDRLMQLHRRHPTRLRIVFHLVGYGKRYLAKAALAAHSVGKFKAFMDAVWNVGRRFRKRHLEGLVRRLGIDLNRVERFLADKTIDRQLVRNSHLQHMRGVTSSRTGYMSFNGIAGRNRNFRYAAIAVYENLYDLAYARAKRTMQRGVGLDKLHGYLVREAERTRPPVPIVLGRTDNGPYRSARFPRAFRGRVDHNGPHSRGPSNARVVIVFACSLATANCANTWRSLRYAADQYPKQVRIVFKHLYHRNMSRQRHAPLLHQASMCAKDQGAFWKFAEAALTSRRSMYWRRPRVIRMMMSWARKFGLNERRFLDCVNSERYRARVGNEVAALKAIGFRYTPSVLIGGLLYEGYMRWSVIAALIREQLRPGVLERMWPSIPAIAD